MNAEQMAAFSAAVSGQATAQAELTAANATLAARSAELEAARARIAELESGEPAVDPNVAVAVAALQAEVSGVLTALGETVPAELSSDIPTLVAQLAEKRAAFAAIIPVNGLSNQGQENPVAPARSAAAFRTQA
jgi:hypothetical protein